MTPSGNCATVTYGYSSGAWGDLLTSYDGSAITYDAIGNPLRYGNYTFTWEGRRLVGATSSSKTMSFTYNAEGIRTSKTVNGVTTNYYLSGSQIVAEETNGNITVYLYNSTGVIGFQYHASTYAADVWDTYFYEKNVQGDIVAVYNTSGTKLISYTYDAWGKFTATYHNNATSSTLKHAFLYRGYYFDMDLTLYYLNSRYYDCITCRFINADTSEVITATPTALTDKNLFAYCDNNPVMRTDGEGEIWNWAIGALVGGAVSAICTMGALLSGAERPENFWKHVGAAAVTGAISGAVAASGVGIVGQVVSNMVLGATLNIADKKIDGVKSSSEILLAAAEGVAMGALSGFIGGKGSATKHTSNSFWRFVQKGNWRYYASQVKKQAIEDGKKAIPGILRSNIPSATKTFLKKLIEWDMR